MRLGIQRAIVALGVVFLASGTFNIGALALNPPSSPDPADGAIIPVTSCYRFSWQSQCGDQIYTSFHIGTSSPPPFYQEVTCGNVFYCPVPFYTTVYWQVILRDNHGNVAAGPVWRFTTCESGCYYNVTPSTVQVFEQGGSVQISISPSSTHPEGCWWEVRDSLDWVDVYPMSGMGNGTVTLTVAPGSGRFGRIDIGWQSGVDYVDINQKECQYAISKTSESFSSSGGSCTVDVTTDTECSVPVCCSWAVTESHDWISVSPSSGTGNKPVTVIVDPNPGGARSGTVTIAGKPFTISQDGQSGGSTCSYSISPQSKTFSYTGETTSITLTTGPDCTWQAVSSRSWIDVQPTYGTGSMSVTITVDANTGSERTGTVTFAGYACTVTQDAAPGSSTPGGSTPPPSGGRTPTLRIDGKTYSQQRQGWEFRFSGFGFTPNSTAQQRIVKPNGEPGGEPIPVDAFGMIYWSYKTSCKDLVGTYDIWVVDSSGVASNHVKEAIDRDPACPVVPTLSIDGKPESERQQGKEPFVFLGTGFTPGGQVQQKFLTPKGELRTGEQLRVTADGTVTWNYTPKCTDEVGTYKVWLEGDPRGSSNQVTEIVLFNPSVSCTPILRIDGVTESRRKQGEEKPFVFTGSGFAPGTTAKLQVNGPGGIKDYEQPVDAYGTVFWEYTAKCTDLVGTYYVYLFGGALRQKSNDVTEIIERGTACPPSAGDASAYFWSQLDSDWSGDYLGLTKRSIRQDGCALTSCAMVLTHYGMEMDPRELNRELGERGYVYVWVQGVQYARIKWDHVASVGNLDYSRERYFDWSDSPADLGVVNKYLDAGYPVIVETRWNHNEDYTHWVVLTGRDGAIYYMNDPMDASPTTSTFNSKYGDPARWIYKAVVFLPKGTPEP